MKTTATLSLLIVQLFVSSGCEATSDPFESDKPKFSKEDSQRHEKLKKEWIREQEKERARRIEEREILNHFTLDKVTFDFTPLAKVLEHVQSVINEQSEVRWEFRIYQTVSDIKAFGYLGAKNEIQYSADITGPIGVGDFFRFLNESTSTTYEIQNNVVYFSRKRNVHYIWD